LRQQLLERLSAVLPPESDSRIEILRELIEVAPFDETPHIELVRALLGRTLVAEAQHQIDASLARFQSDGIDAAPLKSAFAAAQRSVSKPARTSSVEITHLDSPSAQQGARTRQPMIRVMPFVSATPESVADADAITSDIFWPPF
jgi:hypothetical protein